MIFFPSVCYVKIMKTIDRTYRHCFPLIALLQQEISYEHRPQLGKVDRARTHPARCVHPLVLCNTNVRGLNDDEISMRERAGRGGKSSNSVALLRQFNFNSILHYTQRCISRKCQGRADNPPLVKRAKKIKRTARYTVDSLQADVIASDADLDQIKNISWFESRAIFVTLLQQNRELEKNCKFVKT